MKSLMKYYAMMIPFMLACDSTKPQSFERKTKERREVKELLNVFKYTPKELQEKCIKNKKLLLKEGNRFLDCLVENRNKGVEK